MLVMLLVSCTGVATCAQSDAWGPTHLVFHDCVECPEMVVIFPGSFVMGSPESEEGRFEDEGPRHTVTIARPFAVSTTPITRAQYGVFARATQRSDPSGCAGMSDEGTCLIGHSILETGGEAAERRSPIDALGGNDTIVVNVNRPTTILGGAGNEASSCPGRGSAGRSRGALGILPGSLTEHRVLFHNYCAARPDRSGRTPARG